ncbi:MAG: lamin tail domain-containing protein [Kiritimatiellia bacterium]
MLASSPRNYKGAKSMKKCLVGLLCLGMAVTATLGQVATLPISESYTAKQDWTALPGWTGVSIGSYADGRAQFNGNNDSLTVNFDAAPGTLTFDLKGNASTTGTAPTQFDVEESANGNSWSPIASIGEEQLSTSYNTFGPYTLNSDSRFVRWTYVNKYAFNIGLNNVYITSGGPAVFTVVLDKENGFTVEQGTNAVIEAEALNGVAPIDYVWTTDMDPNEYGTFPGDGDGFWIKDNASTGTYYATVTATDSSSPAQTASNTVTFSVIPPAVKYQITINPSINGTVTTTPADEAAANTTVTVNTTPSGGYAVGTITVNGGAVTVSGNTFVMPAEAVTITVTFVESSTSGALIISQYYEGTGYNKWIEIYNPGSSAVDLAAGEYRLGQFSNENRETWKTDGTPSLTVPLSGSIPAAGTYLVGHSSASNPVYAVANQTAGWGFNGDDSVVLYTGGTYAFANVVDAFGLTGNTAKDKSFVRRTSVTSGVNTDFNAADWDEFTLAQVEEAGATVNERVGYHSTGPAEFRVWIDKEDNFTVEQGTAVTFDAETANGVGSPGDYNFVWTTDMDANEYATMHDGFQIKDNASTGTYYATVTVTDLADNTGTATIHFSVVPPVVKYPITIVTNAPANGTVTTTPAGAGCRGRDGYRQRHAG